MHTQTTMTPFSRFPGGFKARARIAARALLLLASLGAALALRPSPALADDADPPARVARLATTQGDVEFASASDGQWSEAGRNRPMITGDRLMTGDDGRAAVQLDGAELRIAERTGFNFLNLDDHTAQVELSGGGGSINIDVRRLDQGDSYEIDTPTMAFVVGEPGEYRIDVLPDGGGSTVVTYRGSGTAYGQDNASYAVRGGQSYRFQDPQLQNVIGGPLPEADDFDRWCFARDEWNRPRATERYVSPEVVGADDLDDFGDWHTTDDYGPVWFPTTVAVGWAPYRAGHWAWIPPWGWTWVDDAPWGYAPFHYGRWVSVGSRWGWMPGPMIARPVYAPALVAFVGGDGWNVSVGIGQPVGWFPLGPREVYCPPYHVTRNYFTQVNVTNVTVVNNTYVSNAYNQYRTRGSLDTMHYAYRNSPRAVTVVSHDAFVNARPISRSMAHLDAETLRQVPVTAHSGATPVAASFGARPVTRGGPAPAEVFHQAPVMHQAPPQAVNRGWQTAAPHNPAPQQPARAPAPAPQQAMRPAPATTQAPAPSNSPPGNSPNAPVYTTRPGELPSARFVPHAGSPQPQMQQPVQPHQSQPQSQPQQRIYNDTEPGRSLPPETHTPQPSHPAEPAQAPASMQAPRNYGTPSPQYVPRPDYSAPQPEPRSQPQQQPQQQQREYTAPRPMPQPQVQQQPQVERTQPAPQPHYEQAPRPAPSQAAPQEMPQYRPQPSYQPQPQQQQQQQQQQQPRFEAPQPRPQAPPQQQQAPHPQPHNQQSRDPNLK